jgi:UDP-N-acetylmuramyl pentapeptide phosphotransferase/UDP-N-acetylglucosamine-1-phosphate transferase
MGAMTGGQTGLTTVARAALLAAGGAGAWAAYRTLRRRPPGGEALWARKNHRGEPVTLLEGPATALAAGAAALAPGVPPRLRVAGGLVALGAGALGGYDDLAGSDGRRGLRGHFGALARGEVTTGAVKTFGIGALGLAAGALVRRSPLDAALAGVVVAGSANLVNLLDLRPGRAIKAAVLLGAPELAGRGPAAALAALPVGAALALAGEDLAERAMLGDAGANALGASLGLATAARAGRAVLALRAATLVALTLASEKVSFTKVIEATPALHALDRLGRRPA